MSQKKDAERYRALKFMAEKATTNQFFRGISIGESLWDDDEEEEECWVVRGAEAGEEFVGYSIDEAVDKAWRFCLYKGWLDKSCGNL